MNAVLLTVLLAVSHDPVATTTLRVVIAAALPDANAQVRRARREGIHLAAESDTAASAIFWTFGVTIKDGKRGALEDLIREMSDATQANEPGALIYEWVISPDGTAAEVHERYADSDAALTHLASFNEHFAARLMALVEPTGMTVYGSPSAALKKELQGANPVYMEVIGGFTR